MDWKLLNIEIQNPTPMKGTRNMMLLAPDLIYSEAGNILWKKQRVKKLTRPEVEEITDAVVSLPLKTEASKLFFLVGNGYHHSIHDRGLRCHLY